MDDTVLRGLPCFYHHLVLTGLRGRSEEEEEEGESKADDPYAHLSKKEKKKLKKQVRPWVLSGQRQEEVSILMLQVGDM